MKNHTNISKFNIGLQANELRIIPVIRRRDGIG